MFNLVQLLANRVKSAGENGKMEKSAVVLGNSLPNPGPTRLGQLAGVNGTKASHQTGLTKELTNPYQPSAIPKPAEGLSTFTGNNAVKDVSSNPIRTNTPPAAPKPTEFTKIPRTTEPRGVGIGKVARNTGIVDCDGETYVNSEDVSLLGKLGFSVDVNEYSMLEKTSEALDLYSYIEKVAGIPVAVTRAVDKGEAFSGSFLEDMEYNVPKGYEVKGDLCCPIEKEASRLRDNVNITAHSDPSGLQEYKASIGDKQLGNMLVADVEGKGKTVAHSMLEPEFRGMGLGKKLYGEVMRRQPEGVLHSGPVMSDEALRVWDSLKRNKGYSVAGEAPELAGQITSKALNIPNKIKKVLSAPAAAEVKESLLGKIKNLLGRVKKASTDTPYSKPTVENPYPGIIGDAGVNTAEGLALYGANKMKNNNVQAALGKSKVPVNAASLLGKARMYGNIVKAAPAVGAVTQANGAYDRFKKEDYVGSAIDGVGALGTVAQLAPHPIAKSVGLGLSAGGAVANAGRDIYKYKNRPVEFRHDPAILNNPGESNPVQLQNTPLAKSGEATHELKSSNIKAVGYDKNDKALEVTFHSGGEYKYNGVPVSLYHRILKAKSPGKFFHKHIKKDNPFEYERLNKAAGIPEHIRKAMLNGEREVLQRSQKASVASRLKNIAAKKHKDELSRLINMGEEKIVHPASAYNNQTSLALNLPSADYEKTQKYILPRKTS